MKLTIDQDLKQAVEEDDTETPQVAGTVNLKIGKSSSCFKALTQEGELIVIRIKAQTDHYLGNNLAQSIMSVYYQGSNKKPKQLQKYFLKDFTDKLVDNTVTGNCTLLSKSTTISQDVKSTTLDTVGRLSAYGLLRYFLWYLITGKDTLDILYDNFTELFFTTLAHSDYALFVKAFNTKQLKGLNVYFKTLPLH